MHARISKPPPESSCLERLVPEGKRLVTPELATGTLARHPRSVLAPYLEMLDRRIELAPIEDSVDRVVAESEPFDPDIDRRLAPLLHRDLVLTRREASDAGVWRYLAVAFRPDYVRHRWENRSWLTMRSRFWSLGARPDSNAFARLWWIAELTVGQSGDYSLTERALRRQALANALFVRGLSSWRPVVVAAVTVLEDASSETIDRCVLGMSRLAATVPLEGLDEAGAIEALRDIQSRQSK